jgi:hypothetical protein
VDPFRSLRVHFGMLLGVDDFETLHAYHRGKTWLHAAWLHGAGAVWGLGVGLDLERGELRVEPGLALDALGREIYLDAPACRHLGRWYAEHRDDPDLAATPIDGGVRFDAHVVVRFRACLARQVPALAEPCEGSGAATAYSRVIETAELLLVPGLAPPPGKSRPLPYPRLRLLFHLAEPREEGGAVLPADQEVLTERRRIGKLPVSEQPQAYLAAFRRFAALDGIELGPAPASEGDEGSLFPGFDPAPVALADVKAVILAPDGDRWVLKAAQVDPTVRSAHVATSSIQELLCGPLFGSAGPVPPPAPIPPGPPPTPPGPPEAPVTPAAGGGPRVDPASVAVKGETLTFRVTAPLSRNSVDPRAVSVSAFDKADGWQPATVKAARYDAARKVVTLELGARPGGNLVRLIVKGTGPFPVLGTDLTPLAGAAGGPGGGAHDGVDFVHMLKLRS